jgi:hypothetical protein
MKQLQVPITEELMFSAKTKAFQEGIHLKTLVALALEQYITANTSTTTNTTNSPIINNSPNTDNTVIINNSTNTSIIDNTKGTSPALLGDDYYLLRKTHKTKTELGARQYSLGPVTWLILDGSKSHFDINGEPIPFRFTDENGKVWEPDEDELRELSNHLGKPVKIEK